MAKPILQEPMPRGHEIYNSFVIVTINFSFIHTLEPLPRGYKIYNFNSHYHSIISQSASNDRIRSKCGYLCFYIPPVSFECKICIEMYTIKCVCYTCKQLVCCVACFQKLMGNRCPLYRGGPPAGNRL